MTLFGQAGRGESVPRSEGTHRGGRDHRYAGHDQPAQRDHAQERVEPDPRSAAPELRDQGRSVEDHQRADARRPDLHGDLQRGRPGDSDSELRADTRRWAWAAPTRRPWPASASAAAHAVRLLDRHAAVGREQQQASSAAWSTNPEMLAQQMGTGGARHRRRSPGRKVAGRRRPRRPRRRRASRLRQPDRPDHLDHQADHLGRRRRPRLDPCRSRRT